VSPILDPQTWFGFRAKYEAEKGPTMTSSLIVWKAAANHFERIVAPIMLSDVTGSKISSYEVGLRTAGLSEASIATYLRAIRAALNWALDIELVRMVPRVRIPKNKGKRRARGRAVTGEEFDRWLMAMKKLVGNSRYRSWERLMRGLWLTGLRLGESLDLWWDREDKIIPLNVDGRRPVLSIPGQLQKSKRDETSPLTPDFVKFLRETPASNRVGPVFSPLGKEGEARSVDYVGRTISAAGTAAKIIVAKDGDSIRFASAHDLRRSFGDRWAQRVMPAVLKELMRHRSIETTMSYYVGRSAEQTADVLWNTMTSAGDIKGDTRKTSKS
jgi:integrase